MNGNTLEKVNDRQLEQVPDAHLRLAALLDEHRGERHLVVLHAFPDPDAISSAMAHRLIGEQFDIDVDIVYTGAISHRQNIALVKLLDIDLIPYDAATVQIEQYDGAVFVDNQAATSRDILEALERAEIPVLVIVDHHQLQPDLEAAFTDIRSIGATATIYAEYLEQGLVRVNKAEPDHVVVATALMHGIMADTGDFVLAGPPDFRAASFLSHFRDADLLSQILNQSRPRQTMDLIQRALSSRLIKENFSLAGIGYLREEDRDTIPQTSAFLLTEEHVHTALVYGIMLTGRGQETLIGSLRTSKPIQDADELIKDVFGQDELGRYYGGGKRSAGGFEIPVGFLAREGDDEYRDLKWQVYDRQVKHKVLSHIGVDLTGDAV